MDEIDISSIVILDRERKDYGDIEALANSIKKQGLLYPPIVERETLRLLDGERRLRACKHLKWKKIPVIYWDTLSPADRKLIELEANLKRKQFLWFEEIKCKLAFHRLMQQKYGKAKKHIGGGWGIQQTADILGESPGIVLYDIQLAEALEKFPMLQDCPNKHTAYNKWKSAEVALCQQVLADKVKVEILKNNTKTNLQLILGDSTEVLRDFKKESVEAVITDPPYGINLDSSSLALNKFIYPDSPKEVFLTLEKVMKELHRVLKPQGKGFIFFHIPYFTKMKDLLSQYFYVFPIPLMWIKPRTSVCAAMFQHRYEAFLYFSKDGSPPLNNGGMSNCLIYDPVDPDKRTHFLEKPEGLIKELVECITSVADTVLDPFSGAGTIPGIAAKLGRKGIGIEKEELYHNAGVARWLADKPKI